MTEEEIRADERAKIHDDAIRADERKKCLDRFTKELCGVGKLFSYHGESNAKVIEAMLRAEEREKLFAKFRKLFMDEVSE